MDYNALYIFARALDYRDLFETAWQVISYVMIITYTTYINFNLLERINRLSS